jgi:hypothetical protein
MPYVSTAATVHFATWIWTFGLRSGIRLSIAMTANEALFALVSLPLRWVPTSRDVLWKPKYVAQWFGCIMCPAMVMGVVAFLLYTVYVDFRRLMERLNLYVQSSRARISGSNSVAVGARRMRSSA